MSCRFLVAVTVAVGWVAPAARGQIQFNLVYGDPAGVGFNDATFGAGRRAVLTQVANDFGRMFDARGTVTLDIFSDTASEFTPLGTAGTLYSVNNRFNNGFAFTRATTTTGVTATSHGDATFFFGQFQFSQQPGVFYNLSNSSAAPGAREFDIYSVAVHELSHALGFTSLVQLNGIPPNQTVSGLANSNTFSQFDRYLTLSQGGSALIPTSGGLPSGPPTEAAIESNNVYFDGFMTRKANSNAVVRIFAPASFNSGSSLAHVDPSLGNAPVMKPSTGPGITSRVYQSYEYAMMIDAGWNTFNWTGTSGNWTDNVSSVITPRWQNADGTNMLSPLGTVTPNVVLRFNGGAGGYASTNGLTLTYTQPGGTVTNRFLVSQLVLNSTAAAQNTIAAAAAQVLRFDTTIGIAPAVTQTNSTAFLVSHPLEIATGRGLAFEGAGTGRVNVTGVIASVNNSTNAGQFSEGTNGNGGTLFKRGAFTLTLTAANSYQGGTDVSAGTLAVRNVTLSGTGTGPVTVNNGGTLAGTHVFVTVQGTGNIAGAVTVQSGGRVAPREAGGDPGLLRINGGLTFATGANYTWYLATRTDAAAAVGLGNGFDQLMVTGGNLSVAGGATMTLSFGTGIGPDTADTFWNAAHQWTVIDVNGGTNTGSTNFGSLTTSSFATGSFALSAVAGGDIVLTFTPVPEPAFGLLAVAVVGLVVRRRGERPA